MYRYDEAITILINHFPEMKNIYELNKDYYEDIPYVFYESEFVKYIVNFANSNDRDKLTEAFKFVEDMLKNGDEKVVNLIKVAVIESLFFENCKDDIKIIESYFGSLTMKSYSDCFQKQP